MDKDLISLLGLPEKGPAMIALVGAGGKTTTMLALAQEYRALNRSVLVTTTTRIFVPPADFGDSLHLGPEPSLLNSPGARGTITVAGGGIENGSKLIGIAPEALDGIFERQTFDVILIEADGSKGKPLKAPAAYEPVVPQGCTHVVGLIGMDAFGEPVDVSWVHRLEAFLSLTGAVQGQPVDGLLLKKLIGSPRGLFKNTPAGAKRILLLNKCTDIFRTEAARTLIAACLQEGVGELTQGAWR